MENKDNKKNKLVYTLSKKNLVSIIIYYLVLIVVCAIFLIYLLLKGVVQESILSDTVLGSLSTSAILCCIQYLKRIYKACIDERIELPLNVAGFKQIGNILYFVLRPVYGCIFVIIMIFALLSGFILIAPSMDFILNYRFFYLCILLSSFIGFSIGRVLDGFESISAKKIDEILKKAGTKDDR
jgi:hypothetical protein